MTDEIVRNEYGTVYAKRGNKLTVIQFSRNGWTLRHTQGGWKVLENGKVFKTSQDAERWAKQNDKNDTF